jgi:hypothetical protein
MEKGIAGNPFQLFGINSQLSDLLLKVSKRLLEHFAMPRILLGGQIMDNSAARELQTFHFTMSHRFCGRHGRPADTGFLAGLRLLRFNRLAFPTACHMMIIRRQDRQLRRAASGKLLSRIPLDSFGWATFGLLDAPEYTVRRFRVPGADPGPGHVFQAVVFIFWFGLQVLIYAKAARDPL